MEHLKGLSMRKMYLHDHMLQVLSSGSWPFQQSCTFSLPSVLEKCVSRSVNKVLRIRVGNNQGFPVFFLVF